MGSGELSPDHRNSEAWQRRIGAARLRHRPHPHPEHHRAVTEPREPLDRITDPDGSRWLYAHAPSADKTLHLYEGFFHDPLKGDLEAFLASSQRKVSGEVVLETRGGRVDAVAIESPHLLHSKGATYAQSADWGVEEAEGFIKLFGMSSTLWAEVNRG